MTSCAASASFCRVATIKKGHNMATIQNDQGKRLDFEEVEAQFDPEIYADVKSIASVPQIVYNLYCMRYREKHGREFPPNVERD